MDALASLLPFVLIFLVFWLLLIRPQRKRQLEMQRTQGEVRVGDQVLLSAGIVGHVTEAGTEFLKLEISPGAHLTVARQAVVRTLVEPVSTTDAPAYDELDEPSDADAPGATYGDPDTPGDPHDPHRPGGA